MNMSKLKNIIGKRIGRLIVIEEDVNHYPVFVKPVGKRHTPYKIHFYLCKCDCKNIISVRKNLLMDGKKQTKSCGCLQKEIIKEIGKQCKFPIGVKPLNDFIHSYKQRAKKGNYSYSLTREEFSNLIKQSCYYCGNPPLELKRADWKLRNDFLIANGIDRINSNKGYELNNVVPCCGDCNYAKSNLSQIEFFKMIDRIYHLHSHEFKELDILQK